MKWREEVWCDEVEGGRCGMMKWRGCGVMKWREEVWYDEVEGGVV